MIAIETNNYYERLSDADLSVKFVNIWAFAGKVVDQEYGWKIHISSVQWEVHDLLDAILPLLIAYEVPFKIAKNATVLAHLNEGSYGYTQVGKFMTIYPPQAICCLDLARDLVEKTSSFSGPKIVTDLYLGGVVYARYGAFNPCVSRDRLGNININQTNPAAAYQVPFKLMPGIDNPFECILKSKVENVSPSNKLVGPGYLMLEAISTHSKGNIFKALDLRSRENIGYVIIKEGRKFCVSDNFGRHIHDRFLHQEKIHHKLAGISAIPRFLGKFDFGDNLYIVLSYVEGTDLEQKIPLSFRSLSKTAQIDRLNELKQLATLIKEIHAKGVIHRDISPRNVRITPDGKVYLLDLELSYDLNDVGSVPYTQGTPGYMSPQQAADEQPSFADDVFAFGAVGLLILTGFDSLRTLYAQMEDAQFIKQIVSLSGAPEALCALMCHCVDKVASNRPSLRQIQQVLEKCINRLTLSSTLSHLERTPVSSGFLIREALKWIHSPMSYEQESRLWFSPEIESSDNVHHVAPIFKHYRSASRGIAGVIYTLSRLHRLGYQHADTRRKVNMAIDWLLRHEPTGDDQMPGLHFGEAGVAVAIAEAVKAGLIDSGDWINPYMDEALSGPLDWPDLTHGAAGQGLAVLICADLLENKALEKHVHRYADYLVEHQQKDGSWILPKGVQGMEGTTYTGFAHGVAGIVYFLCRYTSRYPNKQTESAALAGTKWLLSTVEDSGEDLSVNWPLISGSNTSWKWWCHGGAGIALTFLALYELTKKVKYISWVDKILKLHPTDICYNNLSQCHGLSGLGEIYLDTYRVTKNRIYYNKALKIANKLECLARLDQYGASWLVENAFQPTADLMIGCGGVVHFLARIYRIKKIDYGAPLSIY